MDAALLDKLCRLVGIDPHYTDIWGKTHHLSEPTAQQLLASMGVDGGDGASVQEALRQREFLVWRRCLAPVYVLRREQLPHDVSFSLPERRAAVVMRWRLTLESGEQHGGEFRPAEQTPIASQDLDGERYVRFHLRIPDGIPLGYHRLQLEASDGGAPRQAATTVILTPETCFWPTVLEGTARVWAPAVQIYALRSERQWGVGDFTDLAQCIHASAALGAGALGINPVHALYPHNPEHASPYSPSSRFFYNILYLDVEAIPDYRDCESAQRWVREPAFQKRLSQLRASEQVDYAGVAAMKLPVLERLYHFFCEHHLAHDTRAARAFHEFRRAGGRRLKLHACYEALQAHFHQQDPKVWGWPVWPREYHHPESPAVLDFMAQHEEQIGFYQYLQWCADRQLRDLARDAARAGMALGLYQDLAVGVDRGGAEVWAHQELYALASSVGAPPDDFNLHGQNWGLPPLIPHALRERAYAPFIETLRASMRHAGALRIDHVMGLMRLFWVPGGQTAAHGAYVQYPFDDLLGILALESHRHECLVIGEDLGTVPDAVRRAMERYRILSYRLLYFSKNDQGRYFAPPDFPTQALTAVSTHDLPTLSGFWQGIDLQERVELDLFPSAEQRDQQILLRAEDRARMLFALEREHLLPEGLTVDPASCPDMTPALARAIHRYVARSPAKLMLVQLEDVLGQSRQVNLPGTTDQRPNWRYKLSLDIDALFRDERMRQMGIALSEERRPVRRAAQEEPELPVVEVPAATYRLQFNKDFRFADAVDLIPYLARLGVSHCYASPYLKARAGSTHGYDIVDHRALNPEIGDERDYERYVQVLRDYQMGQIVDIVPNHMGVGGDDNEWWLDLLENGPAALHADYFDIDWRPAKDVLRDKVLLPFLGQVYGKVLESGALRLVFDEDIGEFSIRYYQHRFPVDPGTYPRILSHGLERLEGRFDAADARLNELQSIITALRNLPARHDSAGQRRRDRARDKQLLKQRLARLSQEQREMHDFIAEAVAHFNTEDGARRSFQPLHELLEMQAYRLSYWRVAADEINYRRFFEINDLAGLRIENPEVFSATHQWVIEQFRLRNIAGLRIDHPDGLYDPHQYYRWLQASLAAGRPTTRGAGRVDANTTPTAYVIVEKILAAHERLPSDWPVHGTTGYEFANMVNGLFVYAPAERAFLRIYQRYVRDDTGFDDLLYDRKKLVMRIGLSSELNVLANRLDRLSEPDWHTRDFTRIALRDAIMEVVACFPIYRTYVTAAGPTSDDRRHVEWAVAQAKRRNPAMEASIFDFIRDVLLLDGLEGKDPVYREARIEFALKFQQFTAPVMAKGLEDSAFYIYHPLASLNEVGGDPRRFGTSLAAFHHINSDVSRRWPHTLLSTSTHDTKRSEDVRARLNVLSEMPEVWRRYLARWGRMNRRRKTRVEEHWAPSRNDEYLCYQTLLGMWPTAKPDDARRQELLERADATMRKAVREAKVHTSWLNPNATYEQAMKNFIQGLFHDPERNPFLTELGELYTRVARCGFYNSLSQVLLKLMSPGVPDLYQGNELWDYSMVDPDNRRPVDYLRRQQLLTEMESVDARGEGGARYAQALLESLEDGRAKLYVTWRTLQFRRRHAERLRVASYHPITVDGEKTDHLCAFVRASEAWTSLVLVPRWLYRLLGDSAQPPIGSVWGDDRLILPEGISPARWRNVLTGEIIDEAVHDGARVLSVAQALASFSVGLWLAEPKGT